MIDVRVNDRKKQSVGGGGEGAEEGDVAHRNRPTENQEPLRPNGFFFLFRLTWKCLVWVPGRAGAEGVK